MRIFLSNGDGSESDGLKYLEPVARSFSDGVWVVAPEKDQSGVLYSLSLMNPIRYGGLEQHKFGVEGILHGIPSLVLRQYHTDRDETKWATAECYVPNLIRRLVKKGWAPDLLININFRNVSEGNEKGVSVIFQGKGGLGSVLEYVVDLCGNPYVWINSQCTTIPNIGRSDISAIADSSIALTPLYINFPDPSTHKKLGDLFCDDV